MLLPAHHVLRYFLPSVGTHVCRLEYSHFVSVPLNSSETQAAFEQFKLSVTGDPQAAKALIEESILVATKQIHLTVMMLKLYSEQKRHLAKQVRYCCAQQIPPPMDTFATGYCCVYRMFFDVHLCSTIICYLRLIADTMFLTVPADVG